MARDMTDNERARITGGETGARQTLTPHGQAQRDALVDAAYHLIAEGGFEHLRTREVAGRAGVNIATLHYYFATKEDLIRAVVDRISHEFKTIHSPGADDTDRTPLEELRSELLDMRYHMRNKPQTYSILFELGARALRDPVIHTFMTAMDRGWRAHIEEILADGIREGAFRADMDVAAVAAALVAFFKGASLQFMSNPESFDVDRVLAELDRGLLRDASRTPA
jgi:AcrR family transcriptional regulator